MTEPLDAAARPARRPRGGAGLTIDGDAVVLARRPGVKSEAEKAAATPIVHASDEPGAVTPDAHLFGRTEGRPRRRIRPPQPDLIFQAQSLARFAVPAPGSGRTIFGGEGAMLKAGRIGTLGLLALALLLPAAVLLAPSSPVSATVAAATTGFVLDELGTDISPRGDGAVLSVAGLIRNISDMGGPVPPLQVALADEAGTMQTRSVATGPRSLAAGGALRFHSAVAVPAGTRGDIVVDFATETQGIPFARKTTAE